MALEIGTVSVRARRDHALGEQCIVLFHHAEARPRVARALDFYATGAHPEVTAIRRQLNTLPID